MSASKCHPSSAARPAPPWHCGRLEREGQASCVPTLNSPSGADNMQEGHWAAITHTDTHTHKQHPGSVIKWQGPLLVYLFGYLMKVEGANRRVIEEGTQSVRHDLRWFGSGICFDSRSLFLFMSLPYFISFCPPFLIFFRSLFFSSSLPFFLLSVQQAVALWAFH